MKRCMGEAVSCRWHLFRLRQTNPRLMSGPIDIASLRDFTAPVVPTARHIDSPNPARAGLGWDLTTARQVPKAQHKIGLIKFSRIIFKQPLRVMKIFWAAVAGTTCMTIYSYWKSHKKKEQFEEPQMLGKMAHRAPALPIEMSRALPLGWVLHYAIGFGFVGLYHQLWKRKIVKPTVANGAWLGALSGLVGIAGWHTFFHFHPNPPNTHLRKFYGQLVVAHVIFGVAAAAGYRRCGRRERTKLDQSENIGISKKNKPRQGIKNNRETTPPDSSLITHHPRTFLLHPHPRPWQTVRIVFL